jgi:hypothetical protein
MNDNLTALIVTGPSKEVARFIKETFTVFNSNKITTKTLNSATKNKRLAKPVPAAKTVANKVLYPYSNYATANSSKASLKGENLRLAKDYLKKNRQVTFYELTAYIKKHNSASTPPSNQYLKNFLLTNSYKKYKVTFSDDTTQIIWGK